MSRSNQRSNPQVKGHFYDSNQHFMMSVGHKLIILAQGQNLVKKVNVKVKPKVKHQWSNTQMKGHSFMIPTSNLSCL